MSGVQHGGRVPRTHPEVTALEGAEPYQSHGVRQIRSVRGGSGYARVVLPTGSITPGQIRHIRRCRRVVVARSSLRPAPPHQADGVLQANAGDHEVLRQVLPVRIVDGLHGVRLDQRDQVAYGVAELRLDGNQ